MAKHRPRSRRRTWILRVLVGFAVLVATALAGEVGLRIAYPDGPFTHRLREWSLEPTWLPDAPYRLAPCSDCVPMIGPAQLIGPDPDMERAERSLRIAVLGDSTGHGNGIPHGQNWTFVLQDLLREQLGHDRVQVYNLSVGGYELRQIRASFRNFGRDFKPHVVIYGLFVNDTNRMDLLGLGGHEMLSFVPFVGGIGPAAHLPASLRIAAFRHCYSCQWWVPRLHGLIATHPASRLHRGHANHNMDAEETREMLLGLVDDIRDAGSTPVVVQLPQSIWSRCLTGPPDPECDSMGMVLDLAGQILEERPDTLVLDFRDRMQQAPGIDYTIQDLSPDDRDHYGVQGHRELAHFVGRQLLDRGALPDLDP